MVFGGTRSSAVELSRSLLSISKNPFLEGVGAYLGGEEGEERTFFYNPLPRLKCVQRLSIGFRVT